MLKNIIKLILLKNLCCNMIIMRDQIYYSEKFNSRNIFDDIDNIENLEKNDDKMEPFLMKNDINKDYDYDVDQMFEDLDKVNF